MRRRGGLVFAVVLLLAACTSGEPAAVSRSTAVSSPTKQTLPAAEILGDAASSASGEGGSDVADESPPETVMDLGVELADSPNGSSDALPGASLLDPVPTGARPSARTPSRNTAPAAPSGPTPTGTIEIPAIGLSHTTYEGILLSIIDHGPSHWPGTARPGHKGNTVFPGHRTTHSRPFHNIDHLVPGDSVIFTTNEGRFTYRVSQSFVVDDEETWIVEQGNKHTFTIFACHPKGSARQRYVVTGDLVSAPVPPPTTAPPPTTTTRPPTTTTTAPRGLLDVLFG